MSLLYVLIAYVYESNYTYRLNISIRPLFPFFCYDVTGKNNKECCRMEEIKCGRMEEIYIHKIMVLIIFLNSH